MYSLDDARILTAFGEPTGKNGYLKFFINGSLLVEIRTIPKARLCSGMGGPLPIVNEK